MISIIELGPTVLAYRAEGKIERADIEHIFNEVDEKLASPEKFRMYVEMPSFEGISMEALWQDIRMGVQRLNTISRIEKAAVVTDVGWMKRVAGWEDKIFRGIEIRTFPVGQEAAAREWVLG